MAGSTTGKRIPSTSFTGHKGILLIDAVITQIGWLFTPTTAHTDGGVDGFIEIRRTDTGELTNFILQLQSKATTKDWVAETPEGFDYRVNERDLAYWLQGNTPIILVVCRPDTGEAYWISVKDYFADVGARKNKKVHFDKNRNRFDTTAADAFLALAAPVDVGLYSEPPPSDETLESNLVAVAHFPDHLFVAQSIYIDGAEVSARLRDVVPHPGNEWFVKDRRLFAFHDLRRSPWDKMIEAGTAEQFASSDWATSDDPLVRRDFVRLLNQALRSFFASRGIWRFAPKEAAPTYYFAPDRDDITRRQSWGTHRSASVRSVVKGIASKKEPSRMVCYRHLAVKPRFDRFGGEWFLLIEPTYHFTYDGYKPSGFREEYLSGLKRLEGHQAIYNNLRFWVDALTRRDLFSRDGESLGFGPSVKLQADFGIPDEDWLRKLDPNDVDAFEGDAAGVQQELFNED